LDKYYQQIKQQYQDSSGDATSLFKTILAVARHIGMDEALAILNQCVTEKRLAWLETHLADFERSGNPVLDGYRLFYEAYLVVSVPDDGEIVSQNRSEMVMRWRNHCPTLEACQKLNLDTREICQEAYHQPVQELLTRLDPRLRFERNYEALRPHTPYCEEIIVLKE